MMMQEVRRYIGVVLVALVAAFVSGLAMHFSMLPREGDGGSLQHIIEHSLDLDSKQRQQVGHLEQEFAGRSKALEGELAKANANLAQAIVSERRYGPGVAHAIDRSHHAMGELQKATLAHVFAIRAVLRPDQASRFDTAIAASLTQQGTH